MLHLKKLQSQLIKLTSEDIILLIFNLKKVKFDNNSNSHYYYYIPQLFISLCQLLVLCCDLLVFGIELLSGWCIMM